MKSLFRNCLMLSIPLLIMNCTMMWDVKHVNNITETKQIKNQEFKLSLVQEYSMANYKSEFKEQRKEVEKAILNNIPIDEICKVLEESLEIKIDKETIKKDGEIIYGRPNSYVDYEGYSLKLKEEKGNFIHIIFKYSIRKFNQVYMTPYYEIKIKKIDDNNKENIIMQHADSFEKNEKGLSKSTLFQNWNELISFVKKMPEKIKEDIQKTE